MTSLRKFSHTSFVEILLILVIAGVTYLPNLSRATIYRDDWYYTMDRLIGGPGVFQAMFSIDRPARGPLRRPLGLVASTAPRWAAMEW